MPTFDAGQRILDAIQRLSTTVDDMRVDLNSVRVDLNSIRVDLNSLRADVNGKFEGLELRMSADSYNHTARVYNSHVSSRDTPIRELYNQRNVAEPGFPRDSAALMRLPGNALTTLLEAFQLPTDGNLDSKRRRFREFVGLVSDA